MKLKISTGLSLPTDAVTSTIVVYGGKGMGKTNLASVLVEEFSSAGLRFSVIDPMGVWWGLRHGADGKGLGIKVLILGGIHGDLPITPESGALVADLVVDEDASVIIDISRRADGSMWSISERIRFVRDYVKRIYQRQGEKRRPINQVIDEAARFAPQIVRQGESEVAACMGAVAVLVEEGRNVGVGVTLVTQRSARLNKDVAELADCMIAFRIVGPNSMRAVLDWLGEHVEKARLKEIGEKLRSLPRGSALVISPGWLEFEGIVAMRKRTTFDSSKTPEAGKEVRASGAGAKLDLAKYRTRLAELIDQQKANDPKALKARVSELEKQLAARAPVARAETKKTVERSAIKESQINRIEAALIRGDALIERWDDKSANAFEALRVVKESAREVFHKLGVELGQLRAAIASTKVPSIPVAVRPAIMRPTVVPPRSSHTLVKQQHTSGTDLPVGEAAILRALIQYPDGLQGPQLTVLTGYKQQTRDAYISRLADKGLVQRNRPGHVIATPSGIGALPDAEPLPTGETLRAHWLSKLPSGEAAILTALMNAYPDSVPRNELTEITGYKQQTRDAYLSRMIAKQVVVDVARGVVSASPTLFEVTP